MAEKLSYSSNCERMGFTDFTLDRSLGVGMEALVVVKGLDQPGRRQRLLETYVNGGRFIGREKTRDLSLGFVLGLALNGAINSVENSTWINHLTEPRFVSFMGNSLILCGAGDIRIIDLMTAEEKVIQHPLFGSLHSVASNREKLLVTSTGYDSLIEIDANNWQETWRWTAWENGYSISPRGTRIITKRSKHETLKGQEDVFYVDDLERFGIFGLPSAYRTTHVNEAIYDPANQDFILATFFHQGCLVRLSKKTGESEVVLNGMKSPHAIRESGNGYIITDTRSGLWYQLDNNFKIIREVNFGSFPGKPIELGGLEWLQYVSEFPAGLFVGVDANRSAAIVFDPERRKYNQIAINPDWSVQSIVPISRENMDRLQKFTH